MKPILSLSTLSVSAILLSACGGSSSSNNEPSTPPIVTKTVAVAIGSPDFSSPSTVSIIGTDSEHTAATQLNVQDNSNNTLSVYKDSYYILDQTDGTVTKYLTSNTTTPVWQCSVNGADDTGTNANPYQVVQATDNKAYLIRYGNINGGTSVSGKNIWVINPMIADSSKCGELKTTSIDLSAFDTDKPDMSSGVIVNNKLFVTLQRATGYTFDKTSQVAVIDTTTDQLIDVDPNTDGTQAIDLIGRNPSKIEQDATTGKLYVVNTGNYNAADGFAGIDQIDSSSYQVTNIVAQTAALGNFSNLAIASATKGYFTAWASYGQDVLYQFNPSETSTQTPTNPNADLANITLSGMAFNKDELWVGTTNTIKILNTTTDQVTADVETKMTTKAIGFATQVEQ